MKGLYIKPEPVANDGAIAFLIFLTLTNALTSIIKMMKATLKCTLF